MCHNIYENICKGGYILSFSKGKRVLAYLGLLGSLTILGGCSQQTKNLMYEGHVFHRILAGQHFTSTKTPSQKLAKSVLTLNVVNQLGGLNQIKYNGHGAFVISNNQTNLNANVTSAPYAVNHDDGQGRAYQGDALLNKTTRQYQNRDQTNNGATNWKPSGFIQRNNLHTYYKHAYDRGHLLGYALVGGIQGFNASESNQQNIATQTAWANEAGSSDSTGQNYYEGLVRQALDQNKTVRYRVTNIYQGNDKVPMGAHIEAKSSDGTLQFNVFVPNVQSGLQIDYSSGVTTLVK